MHLERSTRLQDDATRLLHEAVSSFPPTTAPFLPAPIPAYRRPFGDYLLALGYATPRQLGLALRQQQRAHYGAHWRLGDILVEHEIIPPKVLAAVLLVQLADRVAAAHPSAPRFLGEQLIVRDLIVVRQLAAVLEHQSRLRQQGTWVRLGELLVQHKFVELPALDEIFMAQQRV
jgi:hypothetical protein